MQKGTEPWIVFTAIAGAASQIVGFFSLFHLAKNFPVACLLAFSLLSPIVGGIVWQYLNKLNGWRFYLGGPENEPYGLYAAIWGAITILPVAFSVRIATSNLDVNNIIGIIHWFVSWECVFVFAYVLLAALLSVLFYGYSRKVGIRSLVTAWGWSYERTEQAMIVIWSVTLSVAPGISIFLFGGPAAPMKLMPHLLVYLAPAVVSVVLCLFALSAYFGLYDYLNLDQKAQVRGFIAGFVLRFGLFWGTWFAIDTGNVNIIWHMLKNYGVKPFS